MKLTRRERHDRGAERPTPALPEMMKQSAAKHGLLMTGAKTQATPYSPTSSQGPPSSSCMIGDPVAVPVYRIRIMVTKNPTAITGIPARYPATPAPTSRMKPRPRCQPKASRRWAVDVRRATHFQITGRISNVIHVHLYRNFKPPFFLARAIAPDRRVVNLFSV